MRKLSSNFSTERYGLRVRLVEESDAEFILQLRLNERNSRYINKTDVSIDEQRRWILSYKEKEKRGLEYYFIFSQLSTPLGVYRIYNIDGKSFTCGSWVFSTDAPPGAGILGCIIGREIAYEDLGLEKCFTDVKDGNISSIRFQESFNPVIIKKENGSIYYEHIKLNFYKVKSGYIKFCINLLKKTQNGSK